MYRYSRKGNLWKNKNSIFDLGMEIFFFKHKYSPLFGKKNYPQWNFRKNWTSNFLVLGEDLTDWKPVFVELTRVSPVSRVDKDALLVTLRLYPPPRGSVAQMLAKWRTMRVAYRAGDGSMRAVTCETTAAATAKTILPSSIRRALLFNALSNSVMESRGRRRRWNNRLSPEEMRWYAKSRKERRNRRGFNSFVESGYLATFYYNVDKCVEKSIRR